MIWVTLSDATDGKPQTPQGAMALDRILRIIRAARVEAAIRPKQRSHGVLITPQEKEKEELHATLAASSFSTSTTPSAAAASISFLATARLTRTITS